MICTISAKRYEATPSVEDCGDICRCFSMPRYVGTCLLRTSLSALTGPACILPSPAFMKLYGDLPRSNKKGAMSTSILRPELVEDGSRSHVLHASWKDQVQMADGQDTTLIIHRLDLLLASENSHRWYMCVNGKGIQRSFRFKTFKQTWEFMQTVAEKCKSERHHPEWWNVRSRYRKLSSFCPDLINSIL